LLARLTAAVTMFLISIAMARGTTQLTLTPDPLKFARVPVNHAKSLQVKIKNSGKTSITVFSLVKKAPRFTLSNLKLPLTLAAGKTATFTVTFTPISVGQMDGSITLRNKLSHDLLILELQGMGVLPWSLRANPSSLDFGDVAVDKGRKLPLTLTNSGISKVTISQDWISPAGFSFTGLSLPLVLAPGHSVTFDIKFHARALGAAQGAMHVSNPTSPILKIPLSGMGVPGLSITPKNTDFGKVVVGTKLKQTGTLSASGAAVTVHSAASTDSLFVLSGLKFPVTIPLGRDVPFTISFSPVAAGPASGTLSFASSAGNSPREAMTGVGIEPYSVRLSWIASTSQVAGYNVYRRQGTDKYKRINSALVTSTKYADQTVISGTTYSYETKAVASNGRESAPSNQVTVAIP